MMRTVNVHEAKTHLSRLVDEAARGEAFIIAKAGEPRVKVTALEERPSAAARRLGGMEGAFDVPDDFDRMKADEIVRLFEDGA